MSTESRVCLVIGANGFVGSHLVDELVEAGHTVRAFDRFTRPPAFKASKNIKVIAGDVFDDMTIHKALKGVDYVFHSFSATTPYVSDADPYSDITLNLLRNVQLFEKAVEAGVKKFLFISSGGAVYGAIAEQKKVSESDAPLPVSPYGIGKLGAEYYLAYFNRKYGLEYISYRLTNPYGPRQISQHNQGVVPVFIDKITSAESLVVYGDGTASRDYIYIRDATKMIVDSSFSKNAKHSVYNIGSGSQTSLNTMISELEKVLYTKAKVTYADAPKTFLQKSRVSIARFEKDFGKVSKTSLKNGLTLTVKG